VDIRPGQEKGGQLDITRKQGPFQFRLGSVPALQRGADFLGASVVQFQNRQQSYAELPPAGGSLQVAIQCRRNQLIQPGIHEGECVRVIPN
jgi:hypothetical protein